MTVEKQPTKVAKNGEHIEMDLAEAFGGDLAGDWGVVQPHQAVSWVVRVAQYDYCGIPHHQAGTRV